MRKILIFSFIFLNGCAYQSKFQCNSAKGAYCTPMSKVDEMIDSGAIEKLDIDQNKQKLFKIGKKL